MLVGLVLCVEQSQHGGLVVDLNIFPFFGEAAEEEEVLP